MGEEEEKEKDRKARDHHKFMMDRVILKYFPFDVDVISAGKEAVQKCRSDLKAQYSDLKEDPYMLSYLKYEGLEFVQGNGFALGDSMKLLSGLIDDFLGDKLKAFEIFCEKDEQSSLPALRLPCSGSPLDFRTRCFRMQNI